MKYGKIAISKLARAYELNSTTDLTFPEIARALNVKRTTLYNALNNIKKSGYIHKVIPKGRCFSVFMTIKNNPGITLVEIVSKMQSTFKKDISKYCEILQYRGIIKEKRINKYSSTKGYYVIKAHLYENI